MVLSSPHTAECNNEIKLKKFEQVSRDHHQPNFSTIYFENKSSVVYSLASRFLKFLINYTRKPLSPFAIRSVKGEGVLK